MEINNITSYDLHKISLCSDELYSNIAVVIEKAGQAAIAGCHGRACAFFVSFGKTRSAEGV